MTRVSGQKVSQTVTEAWSLWFGKAGKAVWTYPLDFTVSTSLSPLGPSPQPETVEGRGDKDPPSRGSRLRGQDQPLTGNTSQAHLFPMDVVTNYHEFDDLK